MGVKRWIGGALAGAMLLTALPAAGAGRCAGASCSGRAKLHEHKNGAGNGSSRLRRV